MVPENTTCDIDPYLILTVFTVRLGQGLGSRSVSVSA